MLLSDESIAKLCGFTSSGGPGCEVLVPYAPWANRKMIDPFVPMQVRKKVLADTLDPDTKLPIEQKIVSFGLSSFGYDVRLAPEFKIFTNINNALIDPLDTDPECFVEREGDFCIVPPNSYVLGRTIEYFRMPRDVTVVCVGKSTYARCGLLVNVTPIEAGFEGEVVLELSNATPLPIKVYANMGIAQFLFYKGDQECMVSYGDRGGKYQGQRGIQTALV